mgnify:CR=1 FL=1
MAANTHSLALVRASSQYANTPDANDLDFGTGSFTVELWYKVTSLPGFSGLICKDLSDNDGFQLNGTTSFVFRCMSAAGVDATSSFTLTDGGVWHHIACVRNGTTLKVYLDLVEVASGTDNARNITNTAVLGLGTYRSVDVVNHHWDGLIDEVRVWNVERTLAQITANYQKDVTGQSGLVAYWKLNNSDTDETGLGHTLTRGGGAGFSTTVPFGDYANGARGYKSLLGVGQA